MDILLFSERGAPLIHHYRVFSGGSTNISLCGSYMIKLRAFAAEAATRWAHHWDSACPAVTTTSAHPQEVWQQNTDIDLPLWKSRRAVSPRKPDTPTVLVSSFMPKVDIYDGRPPILPIWLQLSDSNSEAISSEEVAMPVSPRLNIIHACSPLRGVCRIPRLLGLLLVTIFVVLARSR